MTTSKLITFIFIITTLSSCLDKLPEFADEQFCPGLKLVDGACPDSDGAVKRSKWDYSSSSDYTFNSSKIDFSSGKVNLKYIDQVDTLADFNNGTHISTQYSNNALTLTSSSDGSLNSLWTPKWSSIKGYWKFNGDWTDSSGNGNDVTSKRLGDAALVTNARYGSSASGFDGTGDAIRIDDAMTETMKSKGSISLWVKSGSDDFTGVSERYLFRSYYDSGNDGVYLRFNNDNTTWFSTTGASNSQRITISDTLNYFPIGHWVHIVATWDFVTNEKMTLFINGVKYQEKGQTSPIGGSLSWSYIGYASVNSFKGQIDEFAIWEDTITSDDVSFIYNLQKQKYSGFYDSSIFDIGLSTANWTDLYTKTSLPFMKEISSLGGSESSADYVSLSGDINNGLVGYWNFNESSFSTAPSSNDFEDKSGNGNHGLAINSPSINSPGKFGRALKLDKTSSQSVNFGSSPSLDFTGDFTVSSWVFLNKYQTDSQGYLVTKGDFSNSGWAIGIIGSSLSCGSARPGAVFFSDGNGTFNVCSSKGLTLGKWTNVQVRYQSGVVSIYFDGVLLGQQASIAVDYDDTLNLFVGKRSPNHWHLSGTVDELAIWNRALSNSELLQVYRRGANRVKYQVRSCSSSTCLGDSFIGPDGTSLTYFSEFHNNSSINASAIPIGNTKATAPKFTFADYVTAPSANRYFQYRVFLESDDEANLCTASACMPEVNEVSLKPDSRYFGNGASVLTKTPISYKKLKSITITDDGICQNAYQLSKDGTTFYYYNGSSWSVVGSDSNRNTKSEIQNSISKFSSQLGAGNLYIKAFLVSDTTQNCSLDELSLEYY